MLFVLDVGNTNIVLGVFDDDELVHHWRLATNQYKTEDEYAIQVESLFAQVDLQFQQIKGIIISSVVPPLITIFERMCEKYFEINPLIVNSDFPRNLQINYANPREVGADRIVNATGAIDKYGSPLIIVDFGTATTYCYIDEHSNYEGGLIAPGIGISTEALFAKAAKLPRIELTRPKNIVGKTTVESMQAGILYGFVGQVDGIVKRIKAEVGTKPKVIATGGMAQLIANESEEIDQVDNNLTLRGLHLIYKSAVK